MTTNTQSFPLSQGRPRRSAPVLSTPRWTLGAALGLGCLLWGIGWHFAAGTRTSVSFVRAEIEPIAAAPDRAAASPLERPLQLGAPLEQAPLSTPPPSPATELPAAAPVDRNAALARSYELEAKQDCKNAAEMLRPFVNASVKDYFLRLRLAYLESCAKLYLEAAKDYAQAARLEPRSIEALLGQQQAALALGDFAGTEYLAKEISRRDANNYLSNSRLAWALYSQKKYPKAREVYAKLVALYPADTEMLLGLAYAQTRQGAKAQAEATFRAVLSILPADKRARAGLEELSKK